MNLNILREGADLARKLSAESEIVIKAFTLGTSVSTTYYLLKNYGAIEIPEEIELRIKKLISEQVRTINELRRMQAKQQRGDYSKPTNDTSLAISLRMQGNA